MDRGAWQATVLGVTESDKTEHAHTQALKSGTRQVWPLSYTFLQHSFERPSPGNQRKKKIIKGIQIGNKEGKLSLFADDLKYICRKSYQKTTYTQQWIWYLQDTKLLHRNLFYFYALAYWLWQIRYSLGTWQLLWLITEGRARLEWSIHALF